MPDTQLNQELALQAAIKAHMDSVVQAATQAARLLEGSGMENNQIRNVLNVGEESDSVAVVTNFVRYQIGRGGTGKAWQHKGFGLRVIEDITGSEGSVLAALEDVMHDVEKRLGEADLSDNLRRQAHVELMRYYLGYLNRAFIFGSSDVKNSWQELERAGKELSHV